LQGHQAPTPSCKSSALTFSGACLVAGLVAAGIVAAICPAGVAAAAGIVEDSIAVVAFATEIAVAGTAIAVVAAVGPGTAETAVGCFALLAIVETSDDLVETVAAPVSGRWRADYSG